MARKNYSEDFGQQAVGLCLNTPGATFKAIAADPGIARGTLQNWVYAQYPEGRTAQESTTSTATGWPSAAWTTWPRCPGPVGPTGRGGTGPR